MANYLKTELWRKAYLIEFYDGSKDNSKVDDIFTFSLPPENEELTYPQRKSETKTFGGLHVDDYGIDAVKIILSGSTINNELKRIYRPGKGEKWLTGEEEIYLLRDLLNKYKTGENINNKIILYDLSKTYNNYYAGGNGASQSHFIRNYWRVFPGEFKIRRSNDRPFTYKYSIEFTAVPLSEGGLDNVSHEAPPPELSPPKLSLLRSLMQKLLAIIDFIDGINGKINDVLAKIDEVSSLISALGSVMEYAAAFATGVVNSIGKTAVGLVNAGKNVVKGANALISMPRDVELAAINIALDVYNAASGLMRSTAVLVDECRKMFDPDSGYWDIPEEVLKQFNTTSAEFKDSIALICDETENLAAELVTAAKSDSIPVFTKSLTNPETGEQGLVPSYGYTKVTLNTTDTMESLAEQYMGSADAAIDIAAYNGIASLDEIKPGDAIKIPITSKSNKNANNRIFARLSERDNYGRDIMLTDDGFVGKSASGDFKLADSAENLSQAVLLRLRESVNKRIRLNAYGIRNNISDPTAGIAYILSSIDLTVRSDPRVKSVDNIRFAGSGDNLNVIVDYRDINNAAGNAGGRA